VSFSSESLSRELRSAVARSPSILWDNQQQPLMIQPSNNSSTPWLSHLAPNQPRQSGRVHKQPSRLAFGFEADHEWKSDAVDHLGVVLEDHCWTNHEWDGICCLLAELDSNHIAANPVLIPTPTACKSKKNDDPDSPGYWEATTGSKMKPFWAAVDKKIQDLVKRKTWSVVPRSKALELGKQVVSGTWAFKKKRASNRTHRKHKARFCVCRDLQKISNKKMQEAIESSDALTEKEFKESLDCYSPVISWVTVQLMMIFGLLLGLQSKQIDFSNAFVQAELEKPVYLEIPWGYESREKGDMVLELHRSLCGQIEAPKLWHEKLKN